MKQIVKWLGAGLSLWMLYKAMMGVNEPYLHRTFFLSAFLCYAYFSEALRCGEQGKKIAQAYNVFLALLGGMTYLYILLHFDRIIIRIRTVDPVHPLDIFFCLVTVFLVLEICRRKVGIVLPIICLVMAAYAFLGMYVPGLAHHRGLGIIGFTESMFLDMLGIYGVPISVASSFIFLFVIFGAFLQKSGAGDFLSDFANALVGHARGGPAKVAVLASALFGSISGAPTANVATTGAFTIPLMKRMGYTPAFAAAVEATASTGGSIMPPVMGGATFLMSEVTGIPYITVIKHAFFPAFLYFLAVGTMVHFEAIKKGLHGMPRDQLPNLVKSLRGAPLFAVPLTVLVYLLIQGYTPMKAGIWGLLTIILMNLLVGKKKMNLSDIAWALTSSSRTAITVVIVCAAAGLIIGLISLTGLSGKLVSLTLSLSGGHLILTLILAMITTIIVGMGMPISASYILVAVIAAPAIVQLGVDVLPAHLFVIYFATVSVLTPPVAITAYTAAGIAEADPVKTGFIAVRLGIAAYIIPFLFVYQPALLLMGDTSDVALAIVTGIIGVMALAAGIQGWLITSCNALERVLLVAGGLVLVFPGLITDLVGFTSIILVIIWQKVKKPKSLAAEG